MGLSENQRDLVASVGFRVQYVTVPGAGNIYTHRFTCTYIYICVSVYVFVCIYIYTHMEDTWPDVSPLSGQQQSFCIAHT